MVLFYYCFAVEKINDLSKPSLIETGEQSDPALLGG